MDEPTRVVMVTSHAFGLRAYEGILSSTAFLDGRIAVPLMIGLPPARAAATVGYASISPLADDHGADVVLAEDGTLLPLAARIRDCRPHYLLVIGWNRLVHPDVLAIPRTVSGDGSPGASGCIGMHPTRLPLGRGQAPIPWTIIRGLRSTALSVFFLETGADTGPIIAQYDLPVRERESAASLFLRVAATHVGAGEDLAEGLARRRVPATVQDETRATRWPKRRPADGELLHSMPFADIERMVRALLGPYPRAFVRVDGRDYPVRAAHLIDAAAAADLPAYEKVTDDEVRFGCPDGVVRLTRCRPGAAAHQ